MRAVDDVLRQVRWVMNIDILTLKYSRIKGGSRSERCGNEFYLSTLPMRLSYELLMPNFRSSTRQMQFLPSKLL